MPTLTYLVHTRTLRRYYAFRQAEAQIHANTPVEVARESLTVGAVTMGPCQEEEEESIPRDVPWEDAIHMYLAGSVSM